jgi:methylmalonyl-CoA/ethylmalonyl-CoA epimerase
MAARMRHIALCVPDPEASAKLFIEAFGFEHVGKTGNGAGVYLSDGVINIALLSYPKGMPGFPPGYKVYGVSHFGMWVDDLDTARKKVEEVGCNHLTGDGNATPGSFYEVKYTDPNGIVFDLTHSGWRGAVKEVVPADMVDVKAEAAE